MNSIAVTTGGTRAKFGKFRGPDTHLSGTGRATQKIETKFFLVLRSGPTGTRTKSLFCYSAG